MPLRTCQAGVRLKGPWRRTSPPHCIPDSGGNPRAHMKLELCRGPVIYYHDRACRCVCGGSRLRWSQISNLRDVLVWCCFPRLYSLLTSYFLAGLTIAMTMTAKVLCAGAARWSERAMPHYTAPAGRRYSTLATALQAVLTKQMADSASNQSSPWQQLHASAAGSGLGVQQVPELLAARQQLKNPPHDWHMTANERRALDRALAGVLRQHTRAEHLELRRLQLDSPADQILYAMEADSVHPVRELQEVRARLHPRSHRLWTLHHTAAPDAAALVALFGALCDQPPSSMAEVRGASHPGGDGAWVTFYSIAASHAGAGGLGLPHTCLKLASAYADGTAQSGAVTGLLTISPLPMANAWLTDAAARLRALPADTALLCAAGQLSSPAAQALHVNPAWVDAVGAPVPPPASAAQLEALELESSVHDLADLFTALSIGAPITEHVDLEEVTRDVMRWYLLYAPRSPATGPAEYDAAPPACPVAAFHLGNGAGLGRVCPAADASELRLAQSSGTMVNYVYRSPTFTADASRTAASRAARVADAKAEIL